MSTSTSKPTKAAALAQVQALIAGTQKRFPNQTFTLGNTTFTTATLVQTLQSLAAAMTAVNTAEASAKDARTALQGVNAKVGPVLRDLRRVILAAFGNSTEALADFGLTPPKARAPRTAEQKAAAAAKLRATRAARGTASKKQKAAVKGNVTGIEIKPVTEPTPSPTPSAQATPATQPAPSTVNTPSQGAPTK
jgi:hypothetical protein